MRTSATGNDAGFSLVEALVTLTIAGLIASAAMLMAPGPDRAVTRAAETLGARLAAAGEAAVIANRRHALVVTEEGYGFERLEEGGWLRLEAGSPLAFRAWPADVTAQLEPEAARAIQFDPLGGAAPGALTLTGAGVTYRIAVDATGGVDVVRAP